jgi:type I restriction enzyme S subunit
MILVPSPALVTAFDDFAGALLWQTHNLQQQNQKLRQTRDLLLPRLMNGELAV